MRSSPNERGPGGDPDLDSTLTTTLSTAHRTRFAEDAKIQLAEAQTFLAAADHLLLAGLLDGDDLVGAAEGAVLLIGRTRGFLDRVLVREVAA